MTGYRKQLIIGIDPGTTTAYAILSIDGQLITLKSSKQLKLDSIVRETHQEGIPLIVGTDRRKCPEMVSKFAAKTGATKAIPDYDLSGIEKNAVTKGFDAKNAHQKDALAAAFIAYKQYEALLKRIDKALIKEGKQELSEEVKSIVITKKISIKKAVNMIEESLPLVRSY
ncbi:hypothetical protein CMO88_01275 [Candidatus Woesearchaeota archaeon]|jgi:hypothetical protein|nr:hypothetical protein [Candidatus Woesearchaeota archaeon]|tara:strand:- start:8391 stop:8900 length:510 start_codon:yes stop_codon:yes gene_type:complete